MKHQITCLLLVGVALAASFVAQASIKNESPPGLVCASPGDRLPCDLAPGRLTAAYLFKAPVPVAPVEFDLPAPGAAVAPVAEPFVFTVLPLRGEGAVPRYPLRL